MSTIQDLLDHINEVGSTLGHGLVGQRLRDYEDNLSQHTQRVIPILKPHPTTDDVIAMVAGFKPKFNRRLDYSEQQDQEIPDTTGINGLMQYIDRSNTDVLGSLPTMQGQNVSPVPGNTGAPWYEPEDYDYQGFINKYGPSVAPKGPGRAHYTDEFKLPSHATFSNESRYSNPFANGHNENLLQGKDYNNSITEGGSWSTDIPSQTFSPSRYNKLTNGIEGVLQYLKRADPDVKINVRQ